MTKIDPIIDTLYEMAKSFEDCVLWTVRAILETDAKISSSFKVVHVLPLEASLYCILPTGNSTYHSQLIMGVNEVDLEAIFPNEANIKIRKDGLGEMANVISGLIIAEDLFVSKFGYLKPSTPFFCEGAFTSRLDWSLQGKVLAFGKEIHLQFSIRSLKESLDSTVEKGTESL